MKEINLQGPYPSHHSDLSVEVSNEAAAAPAEAECIERNCIRRVYWNMAYFLLDAGDGIKHEALFVALSPCELCEHKVMAQELHAALNTLPDTQGRRAYAHYIPGSSKIEIARVEDVTKSRVSESTERGLRNVEKFLKNMFWQAKQSFGKSRDC